MVVEEFQQFQNLFAAIRAFVWFVGVGTLLAGVIGVSNIMLIVVKDRTREIGIRKAVGATPWSIISMILQEAILITSVAGYLGILAGVGLLYGLNRIMALADADIEYFANPSVNLQVIFAALLVLIISGALAGLIPARRAAMIPPVDALRDGV